MGKLQGEEFVSRALYHVSRKWDEGEGGAMDWIDLAQHRGKWRSSVNAVMNLRGEPVTRIKHENEQRF
jgi:hypothetical protein